MGAKGTKSFKLLPAAKIDEVLALAAASVVTPSAGELSRQSKVSYNQVRRILERHGGVLEGLRSANLPPLLERLTAGRDLLLAATMDPQAIDKASLKDRSIALGIVSDKANLEAGRPTQHIAVVVRHEVEALDRLAESLSRALVEARKGNDVSDL